MSSEGSICNSRSSGDGAEKSGRPDLSRFSADEESTNEPVAKDSNEALEQIASEGWCLYPLAAHFVRYDETVRGREPLAHDILRAPRPA